MPVPVKDLKDAKFLDEPLPAGRPVSELKDAEYVDGGSPTPVPKQAPAQPQAPAGPAPGFFEGMSQLTPGNLYTGFMQGYDQMTGMMEQGHAALAALGPGGGEFEYLPETPQQQPPVDRSQLGWFPRAVYDVASNLAPSVAAPVMERGLPGAAVGMAGGAVMGAAGFGAPTAGLGAAPGAAGGAVVGGAAGLSAGTTLGAYEMAVGDNLQTMKEAGVDAGDAQMIALAYAVPYAALEMLQLGVAGKYGLKVLKQSIAGLGIKEITPEIAKSLVARAVKEGGKLAAGVGVEIATEGAQRGISEGAAATGLAASGETAKAADVAEGIPAAMLQEMKDVAPSMILAGGVGGSVSLAKGAYSAATPMDPLKVSREEWVAAGNDPLDHEKAVTEAIESANPADRRKVSGVAMASHLRAQEPLSRTPGDDGTAPPPPPATETAHGTQTEPPADGEPPAPPAAPTTRIQSPEEFEAAGGDMENFTRAGLDAANPEGWTADDDTIEFLHAIETTRESWIEQGGDPEAHRRQVLRGIELGVPVPDEVAAPYYTDNVEEDVAEDPMADVLPATPDVEEVEARRVSDAQTYNAPPAEPELPGMAEPETEASNAPDPVENVAVPDPAVEQGAEAVVEGPPAGMPDTLGTVQEEEEVAPVGEPIVSNPPESETQAESLPTGETQPAPPVAPQSMVDEFQAVLDVDAHPPVYIPTKMLELSKDVPNFKRDADPKTGEVTPLEGDFDDRGVAPIAVWRRTDGRLEVISGRHRLAHAKRNNRNSILSQVFNEADGFGAEQAATLDAELNIRDGHGKVTDYGSYFRRAKLSKDTARKRGLLRDTEARRGFTIGTMGSDDVFTSWENGALETGPALAIVETAGADNTGQAIGLNLAISRPQLALDIPRFRETLKALLHMRVQGDTTMDMFGTETYDTAIEEAERRAAIAGRRQREIADKLSIFRASKVDKTKASNLGIDIDVKDEAAVKAEEKRLRLEAERWRDWPQHPDLVQQVVAEEQGVGEVNPQVDMTPADVEVSDVEAAAEEAVVPVEKPKKRRGRKKDAPAPAPTAPSAGLGDAKEHLKKGFDEAIAGLDELFSKPDDQSTGGPARADAGGVGNLFDPAKYEAALPHLRKAWQEFLAAGKSVGAYYANIIGRYGKAIKPYLDKFVSEALGLSVARSEAKHVVARETQGGYLVASKGLTKASFERFRELCRDNGGRYDSREKAWFFQSAEAVDRVSEAIESFIARLEDQTTADFAAVYEKKAGPALEKTTPRSNEEYRAQVSDETKALLGKGREFGMTKEAVDGQAEDAGRILSAFSDGRKAFILANQAGSGKTFVLGAAIREMRARGVKRFVYYTMNQNLIGQIKRDLAAYGVDDITFATYSELQKASEPLDGAVVIYDESHNIKNIKEAASALKAKASMPDAQFVIFSSATPFENPTQAAYMAASGLFDAFGDESHEGFFCWACAHGATAKIVSRPGYRGAWVEEVVLEWSHKKTDDAKRANQSLRDMGVFQQRRVKLPKGLVSIRLKRVPTTDQNLADIYNRAAAVFDGLVEANPDSFIISSYRENLLKRITEAAKVDAAIAEAKRLLAEGKNIVIFTETKSERQMGKFQSKTEKNSPYYSYPQMLEKMEQWRFEKDLGADSTPPFSSSIMAIAGAMHYAGLDETNLPAVVETLETALSEYGVSIFTGDVSAAKADQNKAAFMSGGNRVLIATMAKGGTGLSLHDQIGNRPTVQVALNLPWTASAVDQVSARTARQGLKSEAEIVWLFSNDLGWESEKLVPRVAGRMKSMGASVSGDVAGVAHLIGGHSDTEFDVSDIRVDEETESALKAVYEGTDVKLSAEAKAGPAAAVEERDAIRARILIAVKGVARGLGLRVNIQMVTADRSIDGAYKDGTVFLNYDGIIENSRRYGVSPEAYAVGKVIHEGIIHHGFSFLSEKSRRHLTAWVEAHVGMEEITRLIPDHEAYRGLSKEALVEEYIARIAERARTDGALTEMQGGVWRRVVAAIRKALRSKMNTDLSAIASTPAEVNKFVASLILDGGRMDTGQSKSTLRWSIEEDFKKVRFVSVARIARMMGDRPEHLDRVIRRMSYAHARLMNGEMTTPDVIRAYVITTASIQAGAMDRDLLEEKSGFRVDDEFCEVSPSGVVTVRPEDAVAAWLMTERGERAVANAARGNVDMKDWENMLFLRRQYGNASVMERMFATNLGGTRITMSNINELTTRLNDARTDPDKFHEALRDLNGVGFGKAPFIAHLLGLGTEPTVDAVEINAWLTGKGSVAGASERIRAHAAFLKRSDVMRGYTHKAITKRVKQLGEMVGQDIDPAVRGTLIHHWLWDAARGSETRHTALYLAMDRMRFSAEADVGNEEHLNAMPRLPKLSNLHPREARELHDGWIEKLEEWLEGAPPTMAFVDPEEGNSLILVSREAYQEGKWRQTFWHKSGDGWAPGGHITFDTRLDAVRDVLVYGVDYDPHILFSAEAYHGSPYRGIEKTGFSTDFIGTGEGVQAYGWGLYFADQESIAEHYRKKLSQRDEYRNVTVDGMPETEAMDKLSGLDYTGLMEVIYYARLYKDPTAGLRYAREYAEKTIAQGEPDGGSRYYDQAKAVLHFLDNHEVVVTPDKISGQLYEVELAPDDDEYLLWDKPLSEQSEKVKKAFMSSAFYKKMMDEQRRVNEEAGYQYFDRDSMSGETWYHMLEMSSSPQEASAFLHSLGIRGIKYLDGDSRSKGEGAFNYVIFNDKDVKVKSVKYSAEVPDESARDAGNVIPLSKRFDATSPDIRYSTAQTDTPEFKKWFGGSKVVDKDGEPLVVYHGTPDAGFSEMETPAFFSSKPVLAEEYTNYRRGWVSPGKAPGIVPAFLRVENPLEIDARGARNDNIPFPGQDWKPKVFGNMPKGAVSVAEAANRAKDMGHDGLIVRNTKDSVWTDGKTTSDVYVVFSPNQIKSATGNSGAFSADNPDIRYSAEIPASDPVSDALDIYGTEIDAANALIRQVNVQLKSKQVPRRQTMSTIYTLVTRIPKDAPGRDKALADFFTAQRAVQTLEAQYKAEANAEQELLYEVDPSAQQGFLFSIEDTSNGRPDNGMASMEMVALAEALIGENNIRVAKSMRNYNGIFRPDTKEITVRSDLFAGDTLTMLLYRKVPTAEQQAELQTQWGFLTGVPASEIVIHYVKRKNGYVVRVIRRNHQAALHTLAHEIGHAEDYSPGPDDDGPTMKRGRILGRIAKLRGYLGTFMGVITADERKALRRQAQRDARQAGFDPKVDKEAFNQAVRQYYGEALAARLQETGDYNENYVGDIPGIRDELEALTQWWRGITPEQMDDYFRKGEELYADMISVLLNQPDEFRVRCPQTYRALGEFFSRHPEMRDTYVEIQTVINEAIEGNPEELMDRRLERLRRMMVRDEEVRRKVIEDRNSEMPRLTWRRFWNDIVRIIQARNVVLPDAESRMAYHDIAYVGGRLKQYHRDVQAQVVKVLDDAGVNLENYGLFLGLRRVAYDEGRQDIANFQGTTDDSAQALLDRMRVTMGDRAFTAMETAAENMADIRERHVFPALEASGLVDAEFLAKLRANRYYSTFEVAKYFAKFSGGDGTKILYKQFGSVNDIMNPFYSTMATDAQIMWAAVNNHSKMKTVEGLRREAPGDIYEAKWTFQGGTRKASNDKSPKLYGLLEWREGTQQKAAIVPLAVAKLYEHNPTVAGPVSAAFFAATSILKRVMTTNNPAFGLGNVMMDFHRTYMNVPTKGFWDEFLLAPSLVFSYVRSLPDAFQDAFRKQSTPLVREMYEKGLLVPGRTFSARKETGIEAYERIQKEWDLDVSKQENLLFRVGRWIFDDFNQSLERLSKIAGYRLLRDSGMSDMDLKRAIRADIGSPDFLQGGSVTPYTNIISLFSNAGVQSLESLGHVAKTRPLTLGLRITLSVVVPKLIMAYFASGADGDDDDDKDELARRYGMIPDRDKAHRLCFPVPWAESGYLSLPTDRAVDFIGTAVWAAVGSENPNKWGEVKKSAASTLMPFGMDSLNSFIDIGRALHDASVGINPYDYFRGVPIVDQTTWEAGGFESAKELGKWAYNEIVGSKVGVEFERPYSVRQSRSSSVPILSPFIRRFYRDSDFGIQEQEMFREKAKEQADARRRMPVKQFIADTVRDMEERDDMSPSEIWGAAKKAGVVPEGYKYSQFRRMLTSTLNRRFGEK